MVRVIRLGAIIPLSFYTVVLIISLLITNQIDLELVKKWGFGFALLLFLGSFPLYKSAYQAGKVTNPTYTAYIPPDEHLHHKLHEDYDRTKKERGHIFQKSLVLAATIILLVTIILAKFF